MGQPSVFVPLPAEVCEAKVNLIMDTFRSQHGKRWFQRETFLSHAAAGNGMQRCQRLRRGFLRPQASALN